MFKSIIYFSSSANDSADLRRFAALSDNFDTFAIFLRGDQANLMGAENARVIVSGDLKFGFFSRVFAQVRALFLLIMHVRFQRDVVVIVKNFDNLITFSLVKLIFRRRNLLLIYEVCDIHRIFFGRFGFFWRSLEKIFVRGFVDKVMTTSLGFNQFWKYEEEEIFLWENFYMGVNSIQDHSLKVDSSVFDRNLIVYHGKLRHVRSLLFLNSFNFFNVNFFGILSIFGKDLEEIRIPKPFSYPADIEKILVKRCLVWCVTGSSTNEKLLLSNRLFDCLAFKCIPVVSSGSYQEIFCKDNLIPCISINLDEHVSDVEASVLKQLAYLSFDYDNSKFVVRSNYVPRYFFEIIDSN